MCTLSYIPLSEDQFFFTTNRDENPNRNALLPASYPIDDSFAIYPKDIQSAGTWMLCSDKDISICLLNGAFEKYEKEASYQKSRGCVVLDIVRFGSVLEFVKQYNFLKIEPFTMVVLSYTSSTRLEEIRWDGASIHYRFLDPKLPRIWSSVTLYNKKVRKERRTWFKAWVDKNNFTKESVIDFHKNAGKEDPVNALVMNRNDFVQTQSITQIRKDHSHQYMYYETLDSSKSIEIVI